MAAYFEQVLGGTYDNHVLPFLWLKGEAHETITEYLEQIAGADIHEVCLESRTHPDFCRDGWWSDLRFIIGECKRLGVKDLAARRRPLPHRLCQRRACGR